MFRLRCLPESKIMTGCAPSVSMSPKRPNNRFRSWLNLIFLIYFRCQSCGLGHYRRFLQLCRDREMKRRRRMWVDPKPRVIHDTSALPRLRSHVRCARTCLDTCRRKKSLEVLETLVGHCRPRVLRGFFFPCWTSAI